MAELLFCNSRNQRKIHPNWSLDAVIYELNVRQFTKEGTFKAAQNHLQRLASLGVKILWMMPIFPIGKERRKGTLGSYYSIADFGAVNEEFGSFDDFKEFVNAAHECGIYVIIDWVTNHTARDAKWVEIHPDWYEWENGEIATPFDWSDTAKLNYNNFDMRREMCEMMKFWLRETGIDGFRMDMAMLVPLDFWDVTIKELENVKSDIFMLAEAQGGEFHKVGFDATYSWDMHHLFNKIANNNANCWDLCELLKKESVEYHCDAIRMQFTSNHDENSWSGSEFERMGDAAETFAALSYVINGMPLIYSGQEVGLNRRLEFFDKDEIEWTKYNENNIYFKLSLLKKQSALFSGKSGGDLVRMECSCGDKIFTVKRKIDNNIVIALFNLSSSEQWFKVWDDDFNGNFKQIGSEINANLKSDENFFLPAWGWFIYYK